MALCLKPIVNVVNGPQRCNQQAGHEKLGYQCWCTGCCYQSAHEGSIVYVCYYNCLICNDNPGYCIDCLRQHEKKCLDKLLNPKPIKRTRKKLFTPDHYDTQRLA